MTSYASATPTKRASQTHVALQQRPVVKINMEVFLAIHVLLGIAFFFVPQQSLFSTFFGVAVIGLGVVWAIIKPPVYVAYVAGYIIGVEVFWRMTDALLFWETGKYAVILILGLSILTRKYKKIPVDILFYLILLFPASLITIDEFGLFSEATRESLSFNLSGPIALFVSAWFFSSIKMRHSEFVRLLFFVVASILPLATVILLQILFQSDIIWNNASNFATSGGYGPNQVSTILGLGVVLAWMIYLSIEEDTSANIVFAFIAIVFFIQALLTFSRGGVLGALVVCSFVSIHMIFQNKRRSKLIIFIVPSILAFSLIIFPILNDFTEGLLLTRFTDVDPSNRDNILTTEIEAFKENPITGTGVGILRSERGGASHTELTRLLADHGVAGATSLVLLIVMALRAYIAPNPVVKRSLIGGLLLWSLIMMSNVAMRNVAIPFIFGLGLAFIQSDEERTSDN